MRNFASARRQSGAVIITVCLFLLFLLGFMGFALDLGRLFIVKTELQTAMDSCALSAAQELDQTGTAIARARSAGRTAGNLNRVNLQSATWDGKGQIDELTSINFFDANFVSTEADEAAKYVECQHTQQDVRLWLLHALGAFWNQPTTFPPLHDVYARAVATRGSAQTSCPLPLAMQPKTAGAGPPNYGYTTGEWVTLLMSQRTDAAGYIGWANLDGSNNASETVAEVQGSCGVPSGAPLGTPGVQTTVARPWNARFGIYPNNANPALERPDFTGYAYTEKNWAPRANAYGDFLARRAAYDNCSGSGSTRVNDCEDVIGRTLNSFQRLLPSGTLGVDGHRTYGLNKRVVLVPVTTSYPGTIQGYACMLMLQPLSIPMVDVQLEYIGNAADPASPCVTNGLPGGVGGPLVPVLVR